MSGKNSCVAVVVLLGLFCCGSAFLTAMAEEDLPELVERAKVYRAHIAKQQRNIALMEDELKIHPDHPNTGRLNNFFATAQGVRTHAFDAEPPYIRSLIDKLEADPVLKAVNGSTMAQHLNNVAYGHFLNEIERSKKFIIMVRRQLKETDAKIAQGKAAIAAEDVTKKAIGQWKNSKGGVISIFEDKDDQTLTAVTKEAAKEDLYQGGKESLVFTGAKASGDKLISNHQYTYFYTSDVTKWKKAGKAIPKPFPNGRIEITISEDGQTMKLSMNEQKYHPVDAVWATQEDYGDACRSTVKVEWTKVSDNPY